MDKLEKGSGNTVLSEREAQLLLRDDEDLVLAVYDYWLAKRLRLGRALIPTVKNISRDGTSSSGNPYLAFSVMLAAGFKGIEEEYPVPPPVEGNVAMMTNEEREARGIKSLPTSLGQALALSEESELLHDALGDHIFQSFIRNKKMEWEEYRSTVTDYEISKYLPML